jgi:hypothetical protein
MRYHQVDVRESKELLNLPQSGIAKMVLYSPSNAAKCDLLFLLHSLSNQIPHTACQRCAQMHLDDMLVLLMVRPSQLLEAVQN